MNISYLITVANEEKEYRKLYETLRINKRPEDNIIVLVDLMKCTPGSDLWLFINKLDSNKEITAIHDHFDDNFADWKNKFKSNPNCNEWLVYLDADELLPPQLIDDLPQILELNPDVDILGLPRQNFTKGITQEDCQRWGWTLDELGRNCWPDVQYRICQNKPSIKWSGKIHETLVGGQIKTTLPIEPEYAILHYKTIDKQRQQNDFYNKLIK